ncbi:regulatory protein RecX [Klenkia sp. PcliD-1-E]|uniref:regulatory protein RecX n=1 Tax=Klenkia sp. PcliD-1-E TaxID=2954492 RepID=UPI0020982B29|nr:regulatory protein RecX [Klenkia sp. PcliD-1-E]MCO7219301.1 recombination regulator RecX [Klenkia sp. PcliD-1-E]
MTDDGHSDTPDGVPGPGPTGDPGAGPLSGAAVPAMAAPEVLDFDGLGDLTVPGGSDVVDFSALDPGAEPAPTTTSGPAHADVVGSLSDRDVESRRTGSTHGLDAGALPPSEVAVAALGDRDAPDATVTEVADPRSFADRGSAGSSRLRSAGRRRAADGAVGDAVGDAVDDRSRRRSSFGDDGSRSFGGRRHGGAGKNKKKPPREWGIQLDAEVDEPTTPAAAPSGVDGVGAGAGGRRSGRQGGLGAGRRPRGADGSPARQYEDPERAAKDICLTALTGTARSRRQLADLLAARDIPDDVAVAVLDRFEEVGLVDDAAFAAVWVRSRQSGRGLSRRALAHELRAKGIDAEVASVALEAVDPQDEWDTARALVARKVPGMRRLDTATATRRLTAMLGRKGYGAGLAAWVVREALEADGEAEDAAAEADDAPPELPDPEPAVRRGLWSGRPLDERDQAPTGEVGEGLTAEGWARTRPPGRGMRRSRS